MNTTADITITVRLSGGAYVASAAGKRASCTMSSEQAAAVLLKKLGLGPDARCELIEHESSSVQRYRVTLKGPTP